MSPAPQIIVPPPIADQCRALARDYVRDEFLASLFAPALLRPPLWVIDAFAGEIGRIPHIVKEPLLGEMRLQWWREALARAWQGAPDPHPIVRGLALLRTVIPSADVLLPLIEAQSTRLSEGGFSSEDTLTHYVDARYTTLLRVKAMILSVDLGGRPNSGLSAAGLAQGLTAILCRTDGAPLQGPLAAAPEALREKAHRYFDELRQSPGPLMGLFAVMLPISLVPYRLKRWQSGAPFRDLPIFLRQLIYLRAALSKRP